MGVPRAQPFVLPGSRQKPEDFPAPAQLGQSAERLSRLVVASAAAKRDALEAPRLNVVGIDLARPLGDGEREPRPVQLDERVGGDAQSLKLQHPIGRLVGEQQNVAGPLLEPRDFDPASPVLELLPELIDVADLEAFPVGLDKIGQLLVDRARLPAAPRAERRRDRLRDGAPLVGKALGDQSAAGEAIALHALAGDIERQTVAQRVSQHRAARPERVPHADFIPDIRIVDRQVGDDEFGQQKVLEHVGVDRPAPPVRVGAMGSKAGVLHRRLEKLLIDRVKIDVLAVGACLGAEGHDDKRAPGGWHRGFSSLAIRPDMRAGTQCLPPPGEDWLASPAIGARFFAPALPGQA